jgi:Fe-S-cluster containining protein
MTMNLEINLKKIAKTAIQKQKENTDFTTFLKAQNSKKVDEIIHRLSDVVMPKIDCLECGNCCNNVRPIATFKEMSPFVEPENFEACKYLKGFACKNLDGKACTIYLDRPNECREFPYMHRDKFVERTNELIQNYEICPIVFNVFEGLKKELKWVSK